MSAYCVILSLFLLGQATPPASQPAANGVAGVVLASMTIDPTETPRLQINQDVKAVTDDELVRLLDQLNDPRFSLRCAAERSLSGVRTTRLPKIVDYYQANESFEVRRLLRHVIEQLFYRNQISGQRGFLGVAAATVHDVEDHAIGGKSDAILVSQVIDGYAAKANGVQDGDLIVAFNGESMTDIFKNPPNEEDVRRLARQQGRQYRPADPQVAAFTQRVKVIEPGETVTMRILRPRRAEHVLTTVVDGAQSLTDGWTVRFDQRDHVLHVLSVDEGSSAEKVGLKKHDCIQLINGQPISASTKGPLAAIKALAAGAELKLTITRSEMVDVAISLQLGSRPMDMLNSVDEIRLKSSFAQWWQEQGGEYIAPLDESVQKVTRQKTVTYESKSTEPLPVDAPLTP